MATKANFTAYHNYVTDSLHQWDLNQVLTVQGLNLASTPEVHFSNKNMDRAIVRQATMENHVVTVNIPNTMLQHPLRIYAHIGIYEGETFKVVELVEIPVIPRVRPCDYQFEDTDGEIYSYNRLENMIENINETWYAMNAQQVQATVTSWLDAHPEATTTVQDGSLAAAKFTDELKLQTIKDYVTPQMYGAKGDGETDDTNAIRAAIAGAAAVFVPKGRYIVSSTIAIPANKTLRLEGDIESLGGKDIDDFTGADVAVVECAADVPVFQLHDGSKLLGGLIYAPVSSRVILLNIGAETMKNVEMSTAIMGERAAGSTAVYFQGSTGTAGSLCFSKFSSAIHGFQNAYFVDRPSGNLPWLTFCDFSGVLSENHKAFTHNLTSYGNALGSSRYRFTVCGGYKWVNSDSALLELIGDGVTIDCKFSDIGAGHNHVYALDLSHVQKATVHNIPFNSPLLLAVSKNRNNFTFGEMGTIETENGTLSFVVNGMVAHVFYTGDIPKGSTYVAVPFYCLVYAKAASGEASMETQQHFPNIILKNSGTSTLKNISLSLSIIVH